MTFLVVVIAACGGGGSSSPSLVSAKVTIDWPSQTRNVTAPTYASSAVISLTPSDSGTPSSWTVDRPAGAEAQTLTYTGPETVRPGPALLNVAFKASTGGSGNTVAAANASVQVDATGTLKNSSGGALGTVGFATSLTGISVNAPDVSISSSATVVVTGQSASGIVALPQDLVDLSVTAGASNVSLTGREVTGVAQGQATIQATFDSFTASDSLTVSVQVANYTRYDFPANRIATNLTTNKIWGSFGSGSAYPNSIVELDATTGVIGTPIPVGSEPSAIAISQDGTVAYVGLNGSSKVRRVDLVNRTAGATISYSNIESDPNMVPDKIAINPNSSDEFIIGVRNLQGGFKRGPYFFRNNTAITAPSSGPIDGFQALGWVNGTEFIRMQGGGGGGLTRYGVNGNAVNVIFNKYTGFTMQGNINFTTNSRIITDDGRILNITDFSHEATLTPPEGILSVATDPTNNIAWAGTGGTTNPLTLRSFELNNYAPTSLRIVKMNGEDYGELKRFGTTGLVISSNKAIYVMNNAQGL